MTTVGGLHLPSLQHNHRTDKNTAVDDDQQRRLSRPSYSNSCLHRPTSHPNCRSHRKMLPLLPFPNLILTLATTVQTLTFHDQNSLSHRPNSCASCCTLGSTPIARVTGSVEAGLLKKKTVTCWSGKPSCCCRMELFRCTILSSSSREKPGRV